MLSCADQRVKEVVTEMDWNGAKAEADRVSRKQWTGSLEPR
jgi:hypothetical protein